jgi:hypothetical protein
MPTNTNTNGTAAEANAAPTAIGIEALTRRVRLSKTGTNACRCWVRQPGLDTAEALGFKQGCGATTRSEFSQGHDAKLKAVLQGAFRASKAIRLQTTEGLLETTAMAVAETRGWEGFLTAPAKTAKTAGPTKAELLEKLAELEAKLAEQTAE